MRRIRNTALALCVLGSLVQYTMPARAGDYYFPSCDVTDYGGPSGSGYYDWVQLYGCSEDCNTLEQRCNALCEGSPVAYMGYNQTFAYCSQQQNGTYSAFCDCAFVANQLTP